MVREGVDLYNITEDPSSLLGAIQTLRQDFDEHIHDGINTKRLENIQAATVFARAKITVGLGNDVAVMDGINATYRFYVGNTNPASASFTITKAGVLTASGATITGTIQTAASGQRIVIQSSDNTMRFYDTVAQVIGIGTAVDNFAITLNLNATPTNNGIAIVLSNASDGIRITSSSTTATQIGFRYTVSGNVANSAIIITQSSTGANNNAPAISITHSGPGIGISQTKSGAGLSMDMSHAGDVTGFRFIHTGAAVGWLLQKQTGNGVAFQIDQDVGNIALLINAVSGATAISIVDASGNASINIDKNTVGQCIALDQDANSASTMTGIYIELINAGAGLEYAFHFAGSESGITAAGNGGFVSNNAGTFTLVGFVRVNRGAEYFIPYGTIA